MNEDVFNMSLRKFLKTVGVRSQQEIEQAVSREMEAKAIAGNESFPATMTLNIPGLKLNVVFDGEVKLQ